MLRPSLLRLLVDITAALLIATVLAAGYFAINWPRLARSVRPHGFNEIKEIFLVLTHLRPRDPCAAHPDGGLPHSGCIRLALINSTRDGLTISTHVFPQSTAPSYRSLSYTWGPAHGVPEDEDSVFRYVPPDGVARTMPKNLHRALFRILELHEGAYYWIDYFCIDQSNMRERSEQVSVMKRIYQRAEAVDVWLGPATDAEAEKVDRVLGDLASLASKYGTEETAGTIRPRSFFVSHPDQLLPKEDWDIMGTFLSRRWFHRVWTLQEFALARDIRIMYGHHFVNYETLHNAVQFLHALGLSMGLDYGSNVTAGTAVMQQSLLRACLHDVNQLERRFISQVPGSVGGGEHLTKGKVPDYESVVAWVFWRSLTTFASDPRDFVFGILGLAEAVVESLNKGSSDDESTISGYNPIVPDYSLSTADVFRAFILQLMHGKLGIRVITLITPGIQTGDEPAYKFQRRSVPSWVDTKNELPSWVPNLANREQFSLSNGGGLLPTSSTNQFNIHGSAAVARTQHFHVNGNDLHVYGRRLGIARRSSRFPSALEWAPCSTFLWNLLQPLSLLPLHYPTSCTDQNSSSKDPSPIEALLSTLSLGTWRPGNRSWSVHGPSLPVWRFEKFIADSLSAYVCAKFASASKNETVDHILVQDSMQMMSLAQSIMGMNETYLQAAYDRWRMPERIFDRSDLLGCLLALDGIAGDFSRTCSRLIQQFPSATSRKVFAMSLDDEFTKTLCTNSAASDEEQHAAVTLLGLGPEAMGQGDEIWALQGSEWPFLLRPLHDDEEQTQYVRGMPFEEDGGSWGGQTGTHARSIQVYELIGEVYVHGIMHGELFDSTQDSSEISEIIIR